MSVIARLKAAGVECYSRAEWGSVRPAAYTKRRSTHPMPDGPARYHFLHITVTADTDTVLEGKNGARKVESYGLSTPPMVSYHGLVTNEGKWFEGQNYGVKGTHTINDKNVAGFPHDLNLYGYAVAIMQNVNDEVSDAQVRVLAMAFAAAELDGYVKRGAPIYPHMKFANKACPGPKAIARLPEIQKLKADYVRNGLPKSATSAPQAPAPEDEMTLEQFKAYMSTLYAATGTEGSWNLKLHAKLDLIITNQAEMKATLARIEDDTDDGTAAHAAVMAKLDEIKAMAEAPLPKL